MGLTIKQQRMVIILIVAAFVLTLNQTLVTPATPAVMRDFGVTAASAQWLTSGFTLVNAIMVPITAYLTDRFHTRTLFIVSTLAFSLGAALCGWAPNFFVLVLGRLIQAIGDGMIMPMVMMVMMLVFPIERRGTALGLFGFVIAFAPAIGPTVGGIVIDHASWHWLFRGTLVLALLLALGAPQISNVTADASRHPKLDILSVVLSSVGFGGLLYGFSSVGFGGLLYGFSTVASGGGNALDLVIAIVAIVAIVWFFKRQLNLETPLLQVRVFKSRKFAIASAIGMLVQASLMCSAVLMPIYIQDLRHMSATISGLLVLPGAILLGCLGLIAGRIFDRRGARTMGIIGTGVLTLTTLVFCFLGDATSTGFIAIVYTVRMAALGMVNMPITTWGMNSIDNRLANHGTSLNNTMRQASGSFGTALIVSVMSFVSTHTTNLSADEAGIRGVNVAFMVAFVLALAAFVLTTVFVHDRRRAPQPTDAVLEQAVAQSTVPYSPIPDAIIENDVYSVHTDDTVADAVHKFVEHHISAMPIIDDSGNAWGVISEGHVVRALADRQQTFLDPIAMILGSGHESTGFDDKLAKVMKLKVTALGTRGFISVRHDTSLEELSRIMSDNHLKKVGVTTHGQLTGVINRSDLIKYALGSTQQQ